MKLFIHYQEQAVIQAYAHDRITKMLTNEVITFEELEGLYDEHQIEDLLNRVGNWDDNGCCYLDENHEPALGAPFEGTEFPLENRIAYVVSEANLHDYLSNNNVDWNHWNGVHPMGVT